MLGVLSRLLDCPRGCLRFRLWTLAHTLGWTTNQPGLAGTVESCLVCAVRRDAWALLTLERPVGSCTGYMPVFPAVLQSVLRSSAIGCVAKSGPLLVSPVARGTCMGSLSTNCAMLPGSSLSIRKGCRTPTREAVGRLQDA